MGNYLEYLVVAASLVFGHGCASETATQAKEIQPDKSSWARKTIAYDRELFELKARRKYLCVEARDDNGLKMGEYVIFYDPCTGVIYRRVESGIVRDSEGRQVAEVTRWDDDGNGILDRKKISAEDGVTTTFLPQKPAGD